MGDVGRIDAFTDAAFAFAVGLLVIGGAGAPADFGELVRALRRLAGNGLAILPLTIGLFVTRPHRVARRVRMTMRWPSLTALLFAAPAAAMPPPVDVSPVVISAPEDARLRGELVQLIERIGGEGHVALRGVAGTDGTFDRCLLDHRPSRACLARYAPKRQEAEPTVSVIIDDPQWRQASVRVRCVGSDERRARGIELYLHDALDDRSNALQQKANLAGCLIGALYGTPSPDGALAE